jgi:hypothetical protein
MQRVLQYVNPAVTFMKIFYTMTYMEALYGGQYWEISENKKDGNLGRKNGNIFLTIWVMMCLVLAYLIIIRIHPPFARFFASRSGLSGSYSGRSAGKLIALVLFGISYPLVLYTAGTVRNFNTYVHNFLQYPDEVKKKANKKILIPFFIVLAAIFLLALL